MTEIQAQTIPHLLEGRDLVGAAKTGKYTLIRWSHKSPAMRIRNDFMQIRILQIWSVRIRILDNKNKITNFLSLNLNLKDWLSSGECLL